MEGAIRAWQARETEAAEKRRRDSEAAMMKARAAARRVLGTLPTVVRPEAITFEESTATTYDFRPFKFTGRSDGSVKMYWTCAECGEKHGRQVTDAADIGAIVMEYREAELPCA